MTDTHFIVHRKSGVDHISFVPSPIPQTARLTLRDGLFIVLFFSAFMGLVFLLAR